MKSLANLPEPVSYTSNGDELLPLHIHIPQSQPDRPAVGIDTQNVATASTMLGVHYSLVGNLATHIDNMVQKDLE